MSYSDYISRKLSRVPPTGIASGFSVPSNLFPHQSALTAWAIRRGRAAIFADTGLGKMRMELAFADAVRRHTKRPVMIHTPLAVAAQLRAEGQRIGIETTNFKAGADLPDVIVPAPDGSVVVVGTGATNVRALQQVVGDADDDGKRH